MAQHPVARDATVYLPARDTTPRVSRKNSPKLSPEEQLQNLAARNHRLARWIAALSILLAAALTILFFCGHQILQEHPIIGQNYQSVDSTAGAATPKEAPNP